MDIYKNEMKDLYQSRPIFFVWGRGRGDRQWVTMPQNINQNIFYLFWVLFYLFPKSWKINKIDYVNFFPIYPPFLGKGGGRGVPHEYSCKKSSMWFKYLDDFEFRVFFKFGKISNILFLAFGQKKLYGCEGGYPRYVI